MKGGGYGPKKVHQYHFNNRQEKKDWGGLNFTPPPLDLLLFSPEFLKSM